MKRFWYIIPAILVITSSCSSLRFTGASYDDVYFRPSENPVTVASTTVPERSADQSYYNNIYAADTLIADQYLPEDEYSAYAAEGETTVVNNYYGSAAERIYLFNDDYFYPYWRDPFYFSPYSMRLSFGYGYGYWSPFGSPYYWGYDPFWYDYYPYSYYSPFYSPYYSYWGGYPYYNNYYGYGLYPWYSGYGYPSYYYGSNEYISNIGRRGGYSTMARGSYSSTDTRSKSGYAPGGNMTSRRLGTTEGTSSGSATTPVTSRRTSAESVTYRDAAAAGTTTGSRRTVETASFNREGTSTGTGSRPEYTRREAGTGIQNQTQTQTRTQSQVRPETSTQTRTQQQVPVRTQTQSVNRPQYQPTERSYTPSYNNPRVSSRPSYNTTRSSGTTTTQSSGNVYNRSSSPGNSSSYTPSRSS